MTLSSLHTISTHKKYRELLEEWTAQHEHDGDKFGDNGEPEPDLSDGHVVVAFRTRPPIDGEVELFDAPLDDEETDEDEAQTTPSISHKPKPAPAPPKVMAQRAPEQFMCGIAAQRRKMVVHVPNMTWRGAGLLHKAFDADVVFGPESSNDEVYARCIVASGLLKLVVDDGGAACVLAYGQTSAGKTYSISALQLAIARDLFVAGIAVPDFHVQVTFLELLGNRARDLMSGANIDIRENDTQSTIQSEHVKNTQELEALIVRCLEHRRTAQTSRNSTSSRSHAILTIRVTGGGELILVDLAGSERHSDSKKHSAARLQETRDNNRSLLALKECIRARVAGSALIPFRTSKLTMVLKPIFDRTTARPTRTVIIAHVSPHIQDAEHSANTLAYAAPFKAAVTTRQSI